MYESRGMIQYYQKNPYNSENHEYGFIESDRGMEEFYRKDGNTVWKRKELKHKKNMPSSLMMSSHEPKQNRKIKLTETMLNKDAELDYFIDEFHEQVEGHSPLSMHKDLVVPTITIKKTHSKRTKKRNHKSKKEGLKKRKRKSQTKKKKRNNPKK